MGGLDLLRSRQVGDGAGYLDDPVVGAGAQAERLKGELQQLSSFSVQAGIPAQFFPAHRAVEGSTGAMPVTLALNRPRRFHPAADLFGRLRSRRLLQQTYRHSGDFQMQVDPVKQRAGQFRAILLDLLRCAGAFALIAGTVKPAGASVKITT